MSWAEARKIIKAAAVSFGFFVAISKIVVMVAKEIAICPFKPGEAKPKMISSTIAAGGSYLFVIRLLLRERMSAIDMGIHSIAV